MTSVPTKTTLNRNKVILIICDGMRSDTAFNEFGYVNSLCFNSNIGKRTISVCDNPSVSRTNYETLCTGVPSLVHGVSSNLLTEKSKMSRNIFNELTKGGKTTAVVGSSWFYDLYGKEKYFYLKHKEINKHDSEPITWGRFFSDDCPDSVDDSSEGLAHTFQLADMIVYKYVPDFLLVHIMTPDNIGHSKGTGKEYSVAINSIDGACGAILPRWLELGYDIIITSDHGMDSNQNHGGSKCDEMLTPFFVLSKKGWDPLPEKMYHIYVAPMIIDRLLSGNDFREYCNKLIKESAYKHAEIDCIKT